MNRSISADLIKAVSIFGVVFIHGANVLGASSSVSIYISRLVSICVPCFILIWAYFFEKSCIKKNKIEIKQYRNKRFIHLFRVFLIWSCLYFFLLVNWSELSFLNFFTKYFLGYGWAGQYYFLILFQLILFFPILRWLYGKKFLRNFLVIFIILLYIFYGYSLSRFPIIMQKLGNRPFIFWIPYVFVGIALVRGELSKISMKWLFIILLIPIEAYSLKLIGIQHRGYFTPVVLISSILFCMALLQNPVNIKNKLFVRIISYVGSNSLIIFVANPFVVITLYKFLPSNLFNGISLFEKIFIPIISTILVICLCLIIYKIIKILKLKTIVL
jgi:hypothetical protein